MPRKPDHAFQTQHHTAYPTDAAGVYRLHPGGETLHLSLAAQDVPPALLNPELERAVAAWVLARGGRELNLNGNRRPITPAELDRPPAYPAQRLASLCPSNTEVVAALGAADRLLAVDESSDYPPAVANLPRLGPDLAANVDTLAAMAPDLVLAGLTVPGMERNLTALDQHALPTLVLAPHSLAEIRDDLVRVGRALGLGPQTHAAVTAMDEALAPYREARRGEPVPVYLEWWHHPMITPGADCWTNELLALAGGVNVFGTRPGQSVQVTPEELAAADPAVIFIAWCGVPYEKLNVARVLRRKGLAGVRAVRRQRVVALDEAYVGRPGPRVVEAVPRMAAVIRQAA